MKGYKITDNGRSHRYGIGADSLAMLKQKASLKFPLKDLHVYLASNGFEVSDEQYFESLEPQTLFIIAGPDEIITIDEEFNYERLRRVPVIKVAELISNFMEQHPQKFHKMITNYERRMRCDPLHSSKTHLSLRSEDSAWFASAQDERCHSKEEAMAKRAQDRIRSYYYRTKDELTRTHLYRSNLRACQIIDSILRKFRYLLIGCDYFSMMFDRKYPRKHASVMVFDESEDDETDARCAAAIPNKRLKQIIKRYAAQHELLDAWSLSLCTDLGQFQCQGAFSAPSNSNNNNNNNCSLQHTINPYASRENLILFQIWNLDHQIELCRSVVPALVRDVRTLVEQPQTKCAQHKKRCVVDVSVLEYFLEIFSLKNLKLVHIVCHEKVQRANNSNGRLICEECREYRIVEDLMAVRCDEADNVDAF